MQWTEATVTTRQHPVDKHGTQTVYRFPNGYGASVVQASWSYGSDDGLFELGVIKFSGEGDYAFSLTYDTNITNDVIGNLTEQDVQDLLNKIKYLPRSDNE